jgi:hypothetical protein
VNTSIIAYRGDQVTFDWPEGIDVEDFRTRARAAIDNHCEVLRVKLRRELNDMLVPDFLSLE